MSRSPFACLSLRCRRAMCKIVQMLQGVKCTSYESASQRLWDHRQSHQSLQSCTWLLPIYIPYYFDTVFTRKCQIIPQSSLMSDSLFYKGLIQFPKPSVNISRRSSQERNTIPYPVVGKLNSPAIPISLAPQFMSSWRITSLSMVSKSPEWVIPFANGWTHSSEATHLRIPGKLGCSERLPPDRLRPTPTGPWICCDMFSCSPMVETLNLPSDFSSAVLPLS